jgi:6-phosphogluconolactonase
VYNRAHQENAMPNMTRRTLLGAGAAVLVGGRPAFMSAQSSLHRVFVGTLTNASGEIIPANFGGKRPPGNVSRGLYTFTFDSKTGRAGDISLAIEVSNPFNLTVHSNKRALYACRWPTEIDGQNVVTAFAVEGATLRELNTIRSGGGGPTVGVVDKAGRNLLITNFVTSSIVCFRLNSDGSLRGRSAMIGQEPTGVVRSAAGSSAGAPNDPGGPHAVGLSATERFAIVPEITAHRCRVMRFDASKGSLETHQLADDVPGAGPRHLAWHPSYRYLYTSGERTSSISAWSWDESKGELKLLQNLTTRPGGFASDNRPADIAMHPSGNFVYVTNRSTGTLSGFRIDRSTGKLNAISQVPLGSQSSWSMLFDATGKWALAAAQLGDEVVIYSVDQKTGSLKSTGQTLRVVSPICLRWA